METKEYIRNFCSLGPKQYAYLSGEEKVVKVRGFTLKSAAALDKLNFDTMNDMLKDWVVNRNTRTVDISMFTMKGDRLQQTVTSMDITKKYRNDGFAKRFLPLGPGQEHLLDEQFTSFPYGARSLNFADQP